jgi:hypothetical protein
MAELYPSDQNGLPPQVRTRLDAASFTSAWEQGTALSLEQAIAFASADG